MDKSFDHNVCLVCRTGTIKEFVKNPSSHDEVLKSVEEWASYGDIQYFDLWAKLKSIPIEEVRKAS